MSRRRSVPSAFATPATPRHAFSSPQSPPRRLTYSQSVTHLPAVVAKRGTASRSATAAPAVGGGAGQVVQGAPAADAGAGAAKAASTSAAGEGTGKAEQITTKDAVSSEHKSNDAHPAPTPAAQEHTAPAPSASEPTSRAVSTSAHSILSPTPPTPTPAPSQAPVPPTFLELAHCRKSRKALRSIKKSGVRAYYEHQNEVLDAFKEVDLVLRIADGEEGEGDSDEDASVDEHGASSKATSHIDGSTTTGVKDGRNGNPLPSIGGSSANSVAARNNHGLTEDGGESVGETTALLPKSKAERDAAARKSENVAINVNMGLNFVLFLGKGVAVLSSRSITLVASLVDSALDLLSTLIIFGTNKAVEHRSPRTMYRYPVGKRRLGPLGVVVFSVLMIASFVQVLIESLDRLYKMVTLGPAAGVEPKLGTLGIVFMVVTIVAKGIMYLIYKDAKSSSVKALAQDAENDVFFNLLSLIFPLIGDKLNAPHLDPIGGALLSLYIIMEWIGTLRETVERLSGSVASDIEIQRALYLLTRFAAIDSISHLAVYHQGDQTVIECDLILNGNMSLGEAHDLVETITYALESLDNVERAFVHLDTKVGGPPSHLSRSG